MGTIQNSRDELMLAVSLMLTPITSFPNLSGLAMEGHVITYSYNREALMELRVNDQIKHPFSLLD